MKRSPDRHRREPSPTVARWREVEGLLDAALALRPDERSDFLADECEGDPELRREVESLLARYPALDGFLGEPAVESALSLDSDLTAVAFEGREVVPYRIVRELARGGMGWVFLAERADGQFDQLVALKLLRPALEQHEAARRFEAERRILSRLEHPSIARLIDAGITERGRPYLVTEYVRGAPIDRYCEERRLHLNARIALFRRVAKAVQYAHRNLVVHRDLKPSNIFVTPDAQVKLLDFGIAKLLAAHVDPRAAPTTRPGRRWMTAAYAAPEQIVGERITTATDIYQLGVVLYELLSGHRPFEREDETLYGLESAIVQSDPEPPSVAANRRSGEENRPGERAPEQIARARRVRPATLRRALRGDLDAIVLRALAKEPQDRYPSVQALVDDLDRHGRGHPIDARRGTFWYRTRKFFRRHRVPSLAAAAVALAIIGGAAAAAHQAAEARRERDRARTARAEAELALGRARDVTGILVDLLRAADPSEYGPADTAATRTLLDLGMARVEELEGRPMVRAELLEALARIHANVGKISEAETLARRALILRRQSGGARHPDVATSLRSLAEVLRYQGRHQEAEALLRQALELQIDILGPNHPEVAWTLTRLAARPARGDLVAAETLYERALEIRRTSLRPDHPLIGKALLGVGRIKRRVGKPDEAEAAYREAIDLLRRELGPDHPDVAASMVYLADLLRRFRAEDVRAESLYRKALAIQRRALGDDHPALTHAMGSLARLLSDRGDHAAAESLLRKDLELRRRAFGPEHRAVAERLGSLAEELRRQGRLQEAERLQREGLAIWKRTVGSEHWAVSGSLAGLAGVLVEQGRYAEAERLYQRALEIRRTTRGDRHHGVGLLLTDLGRLETRRGNFARAESLHHQALGIILEDRTAQHPSVRRVERSLADLYAEWGRTEKARRYRRLAGWD